ncbi:metallopeptidase TldD-related protein [Paraburkholderia sp. BCC1885]|uniref:metallopeptidase TldD-related protein n=1 Tax=Paraburkholderia sp. BCC1885 TaxID=2562669 RepID=UPI00118344F0|nr:metallopeptidase TldD-related protein [Paraburkholderia sp. BCC1885]
MQKIDVLLNRFELHKAQLSTALGQAMTTASDFGDLYLQTSTHTTLSLENGDVKATTFDRKHGFGLRVVQGERTAFAHSSRSDDVSLREASAIVRAATAAGGSTQPIVVACYAAPSRYDSPDHDASTDTEAQVRLLRQLEKIARASDERVDQVFTTLTNTCEEVLVLRSDGRLCADIRPMAMLGLTVVVREGARSERASSTVGGRRDPSSFDEAALESLARSVIECAVVNLGAQSITGGEMTVVIGPGWPGVLLHEAVGHGLESDQTRRGASVFSNRVGERVAAPGVTVVDDGTIAHARGALSVDDEGNPSRHNVLIEDGILRGYMHDELNARLMGVAATGNGRRESYAHLPKPRMTTTFMQQGALHAEEIIGSVKKGLYVADMQGGQVDTISGNFVFATAKAFLIEAGKLTHPVKGATIIGNGPKAIMNISKIGRDFAFDPGRGVCTKAGQSVPVGVGQPTLKITGLTVGGSA